jgi:flagellar hook-basal body protein
VSWLNTDEGTAGVDEEQTITGTAASGTFTLSYGGETTGVLDWNDTAGDIETALELLTGIDDVTVAGGPLGTAGVTVTFDGALVEETDVALLTVNDIDLAGGTVSVAETTTGRAVQGVLGSEATASLVNGKIVITDAVGGYSKTDLEMVYSDAGDDTSLTMASYFEVLTVGGDEVKNINITVYDTQGGKHVLSAALVRTGTANTWDMILTSITGNIYDVTMGNRRIEGIEFDAGTGSYTGLNTTIGDDAEFVVTFGHDTTSSQTIAISMGTVGQLDGLTQFAGNSTAVAREQDGYEAGRLTTVSVDNEGTVIGAFSNGIKKNIATIQIALFQNPAALESMGSGYFSTSANSGEAVATQALTGGAGSIHGGALEKSNADVATEFVNMIQAQNGFQANARTIKVANEILRELTSLIR